MLPGDSWERLASRRGRWREWFGRRRRTARGCSRGRYRWTQSHRVSSRLCSVSQTRTETLSATTNNISPTVSEADSLYSFKCKLKIHLFTLCFNDWLSVFTNFCNAFLVQSPRREGLTTAYLLTYVYRLRAIDGFALSMDRVALLLDNRSFAQQSSDGVH